MLEKPSIPDETLVSAVQTAFGLRVTELTFLPLGADQNTAAYRAEADSRACFLKLRSGICHEASVTLPRLMSNWGIEHLIVPLETLGGHLWAELNPVRLLFYPFITGRDGYEVALSDDQWIDLGRTMRRIHTMALPVDLRRQIRLEPDRVSLGRTILGICLPGSRPCRKPRCWWRDPGPVLGKIANGSFAMPSRVPRRWRGYEYRRCRPKTPCVTAISTRAMC